MQCDEQIKQAISGIASGVPYKDGCLVGTSCLYPSGEVVKVLITKKDKKSYIVSDLANGLAQIIARNIDHSKPGYYLAHFARRWGVDYSRGVISSIATSIEEIELAILLVANASKDGVVKMLERHSYSLKPTFKKTFGDFLNSEYEGKFRKGVLTGYSRKVHHLDYVHDKSNLPDIDLTRPVLILDTVQPGELAISVKAQHHRDIQSLGNNRIKQQLVFDDVVDEWTKADLAYLDVTGVPSIAFTELEQKLPAMLNV